MLPWVSGHAKRLKFGLKLAQGANALIRLDVGVGLPETSFFAYVKNHNFKLSFFSFYWHTPRRNVSPVFWHHEHNEPS